MTRTIPTRALRALCLTIACALLALVLMPEAGTAGKKRKSDSVRLRKAVTVRGIQKHLKALQDIAVANDGNRASGFAGFDASADYVRAQLEGAGYTVNEQEFDFDAFLPQSPPELEQTAPNTTTYANETDFVYMEYSGTGEVTAHVTNVDLVLPPAEEPNTSNSGCEEEDFASFPEGDIALMQRGTCDFGLKAENAANAGAVGAIIFNEGQEGRQDLLAGTLGDFRPGIPTFGTTFALGEALGNTEDLELRMFADTLIETRTTSNLLAQTAAGDADNVVMVGGHLDSVAEGPGIQDNGSGTMAILEIARKMAKLELKTKNAVRFAFWGAEESGLVGSTHYVDDLATNAPTELEKIALYLNFDMIASPNFIRAVYDGDGSAFGLEGPAGSDHIEATFTDFWSKKGLESEETPFDGRSDYEAFVFADIPAGGLFSGAEVLKTEEQEEIYGGVAGLPYDPCYHQSCDTYFNVNTTALDQFSDAIAHAVARYSRTTKGIGEAPAPKGASAQRSTYRGSHSVR